MSISTLPDSASLSVTLGPGTRCTPEAIAKQSSAPRVRVTLDADARTAMRRSREALDRALEAGCQVYGLTTGFGPHVRHTGDADPERQGEQLTAHLCAGFGPPAPREVVRAAMLLRLATMARGCSGVDPEVAQRIADTLVTGFTPVVPSCGSVGASGDLVPLAHAARALMGLGEAEFDGEIMPAERALARAGIEPVRFGARDALAFVNGTSFMAAYLTHAVVAGERLVQSSEAVTGWAYRQLGARTSPLDLRLHTLRNHRGQLESAWNIAAEAERDGTWDESSRPLQEIYSIRCAPQILGGCRDALDFARTIVERELGGVSDNPVIDAEATDPRDAVLHGGNFQGQQLAFAGDALAAALAQVGVLVDRQIAAIVDAEVNDGAPTLLAATPGESSGVAGVQLCATAMTNQLKHNATPAAFSSIPTNGRNQDVVSMGLHAAQHAHAQAEPLSGVLAVASICLSQLDFLRREGFARGRTTAAPDWFPGFEPMRRDRPLDADVARIASAYRGAPAQRCEAHADAA
jgi:tyrosine ammonia-lyase